MTEQDAQTFKKNFLKLAVLSYHTNEGTALCNETKINIPCIFSQYTTPKLITMSWLEGLSINSLLKSSFNNRKLREKVATNIFNAWYKPLYSFAIIHGDPHFGNYSFTKNGNVNLFDFGCVRVFSVNFVKAIKSKYKYLIITEHFPSSKNFVANLDKPTGPDIRLLDKSAVILTEPPFNLKVVKDSDICETHSDSIEGVLKTKLLQLFI
mgnify:CR=1 FL=1